MDELLVSRPSIGTMINSKLEPIIARVLTRKTRPFNQNRNQRNRNTVKGLSVLLSRAPGKTQEFINKREWLTRFGAALNMEYTAPILKIEAQSRLEEPVERTRKYKMPAPANGKFPTLYGKSKTGKTQVWQIEVIKQGGGPAAAGGGETALIRVTYGYEDGKQVVNEKEITKGKNLGKKNETTPHEQALLEAQSTWEGKIDGGYAEKLGNAQAPSMATANAVAAHKTVSPMLAPDYHKQG